MTLTWVKAGEVISVRNEIALTTEPEMVCSACDAAHKAYYCATCMRFLANIGQVLMHAEAAGGSHHIAAWCPSHRVHEAAQQSQIDAFAAVTPTEAGQ